MYLAQHAQPHRSDYAVWCDHAPRKSLVGDSNTVSARNRSCRSDQAKEFSILRLSPRRHGTERPRKLVRLPRLLATPLWAWLPQPRRRFVYRESARQDCAATWPLLGLDLRIPKGGSTEGAGPERSMSHCSRGHTYKARRSPTGHQWFFLRLKAPARSVGKSRRG